MNTCDCIICFKRPTWTLDDITIFLNKHHSDESHVKHLKYNSYKYYCKTCKKEMYTGSYGSYCYCLSCHQKYEKNMELKQNKPQIKKPIEIVDYDFLD